ncbi:MAG TPA: MarR family transcriptional regulator [Rubrivivax sp.]|nr:MarR family transcriptional regulator [Rubrivivax sp.]
MSPPPAAADAGRADTAAATQARVMRQFRQILNLVRAHFQQVEKQAGLGGAQVWALALLRDTPGIGVTELARRMDIHQSTASNLVRALTQAGLVRAERKGSDRRTVQLHPRAAGLRRLERASGPFAGLLPQALQALDPALLKRLEADLGVLLAALQTDARSARMPLAVISMSDVADENDFHS